jgi:hypothetical protein
MKISKQKNNFYFAVLPSVNYYHVTYAVEINWLNYTIVIRP